MKIGDVIDRDLTAVTVEMAVGEVIEILARHRLSGVPVVDEEGHVRGFVSEEDIVKAALPGYFEYLQNASAIPDFGQFQTRLRRISREPVAKYMNTATTVFQEDDSDFSVAMTMIQKNAKRSPVVRQGILVGAVNRADLLERILAEDPGRPGR